ncbi:F0F1 ATP synthase subunit delta [Jonesiaceae bacterium BS-20]|uniref:ATP synthase subunit delta n=1 Tax=Jonesiaceae bacterium BS-20 TaxID=3120821 RepID=A0AAU7DXZ1_9MICO
MRGTSQASYEATRAAVDPVLVAAGEDAKTIGEQLFAVVDALDSSGSLRRSVADPSRSAKDKSALISAVLSGGFDPRTVSIMEALVSQRWSRDTELVNSVSLLAIDAYLASAQSRDALIRVESELFAIIHGLDGQRELRQALSDSSTDASRRVRLVEELVAGKADPVTVALAARATAVPRGERFVPALARISDVAAARRKRTVAHVKTGSPLSQAQQDRLEQLLTNAYGYGMQLDIAVEPSVIGGMRIQVGTDVVDATVLSRLADARRELAG